MTFDEAYQKYKPLLNSIITRYKYKMPSQCHDVIESRTLECFWQCYKKFDPGKGVKFTTYFSNMAHFKINDGLRKLLGRGVKRIILNEAKSIEETIGFDENREITLREVIEDPKSMERECPLDVDRILMGLNPTEHAIIHMYYIQNCTMKEIGESLGLSESRISQMHKHLILRLRERDLCTT